jgi:hypothetical protein
MVAIVAITKKKNEKRNQTLDQGHLHYMLAGGKIQEMQLLFQTQISILQAFTAQVVHTPYCHSSNSIK